MVIINSCYSIWCFISCNVLYPPLNVPFQFSCIQHMCFGQIMSKEKP